jgi:hypothetical protein
MIVQARPKTSRNIAKARGYSQGYQIYYYKNISVISHHYTINSTSSLAARNYNKNAKLRQRSSAFFIVGEVKDFGGGLVYAYRRA